MSVCLIEPMKLPVDPWRLYEALDLGAEAIFLDSAKKDDEQSGFSIIGLDAGDRLLMSGTSGSRDFEELQRRLDRYRIDNATHLPFVGGAMGYFSYDLGRRLEGVATRHEALSGLPEAYLVFYSHVLVYDHALDTYFATGIGRDEAAVQKSLRPWLERIRAAAASAASAGEDRPSARRADLPVSSPFAKGSYVEAVERMRRYIEEGDIYVANMTQTLTVPWTGGDRELYGILREANPAPFAAFLPLEGFSVLSSSPERFMGIRDGHAQTRPIKGTLPRGKTPEEDAANRKALAESGKDKSELLMIVDLERNDLSKVCRPGSVKATDLFKVEAYATVFHLVATVEGDLEEGKTAVDCFRACFPGGSITGAPKIRAMEIVDELERNSRGIYTGCIGYLGYDGAMDMNIVIRTILLKDGVARIGAGGGITWESDAAAEYEETLDKAEALLRSLGGRLAR